MLVEIILEGAEFFFQIGCPPESCLVPVLPTDRPDQSFHERMRSGDVPHGFDFLDHKDTEVGLPRMKPIQRIMIGTQRFRQCLCVNRSMEHPAQNPTSSPYGRLASKSIQRPPRVFRVSYQGKPGRTSRSGLRMEGRGENLADDVLVDVDAECQ